MHWTQKLSQALQLHSHITKVAKHCQKVEKVYYMYRTVKPVFNGPWLLNGEAKSGLCRQVTFI